MKSLLLIILLNLPILMLGQSLEELDRRNGFKDIKLATDANSYEGLEFEKVIKGKDIENIEIFKRKNGAYSTIGEIKVTELEVRAYKGKIFEIKVVTEHNEKLIKALEKAFGEARYSMRSNIYYWRTEKLSLSWKSHSKGKTMMLYHSYVMRDLIRQDKKKEIADLAEDF